MTLFKKNHFVFLLLAILIGIVYVNSLGNGLVTDDEGLVKEGANWLNWQRILFDPETGKISAAPLRSLVYSLTYLAVGIVPWVLRLENILFHLGSVFLGYLIVKRLINSKVALLAAVLWAVHPLPVEAVTWISGGGHVQYTFFFLASFLFYLKKEEKKWFYYLSLVFFVLMLLSLNRSLVLAAVFPLYEFCFASKTGGLKKNWQKILPYLVISSVWLTTFFWAIGRRATILEETYYKDGLLYNPLLQWPQAIGSYLTMLFWPQHLTYVHTNTQTPLVYSFRVLILLGYFGSLVWAYLKKKSLLFWLVLFLIPLLPSLTPLKIAFIVAERYAYLSSLSILVVASYFIVRLFKYKELKVLIFGLIGLVVVILGTRSIIRNTDWKDGNTLWRRTTEVSQDSSQAQFNVALKAAKEKNYAEAEKGFILAISINPKIADYYYNLAVLYLKTGHRDKALENFKKALELKPQYPEAQKGVDLLQKAP